MDANGINPLKVGLSNVIQVIILFTVLSLFFFLYVSKIEAKVFEDEIDSAVKDNITKLLAKNNVSKNNVRAMIPVLEKVQKLYEGPDSASIERNIVVKFSAFFTILFLISIIATIVISLNFGCNKSVSVKELVLENLIIFAFVGVVEYMFFTHVAIKYVPVKPSTMINTAISEFKKELA